jgi:hypothetical protein
MKIRLLVVLLLFYGRCSFSQNLLTTKIDFVATNVPIDRALELLEEKIEVDISYSKNFFIGKPPITINVKQTSISEILTSILKNTEVEFKTSGNNRILLYLAKETEITLSGYVEDAESGERIVGARITVNPENRIAITNEYGFFTLKVNPSEAEISVHSLGYKSTIKTYSLNESDRFLFKMTPADDLPVVVVDLKQKTASLEHSPIAIDKDNITEISSKLPQLLPSLNGQADYVRVMQLLPGIQGQADGFGGVNIRGGESGQNLMMMDGSAVYIPYHLLGLFSIYNPETVKSLKVVKGNFPARYGGAASSILDVQIKEGDLYKWKGSADVNFLSAGALVEGPIKKNIGSILVAGRLSPNAYFFQPTLARLYFQNQVDELNTNFYDLNVKTNFKFGQKDRLYLSYFVGKDKVLQNSSIIYNSEAKEFAVFELEWQNTVGSVRWNHLFSNKLFANTTFTYSNFNNRFSSQREFVINSETTNVRENFVIDNRSKNVDYGVKSDLDFAINKKNKLRVGLHYNYRNFRPSFYFFQDIDLSFEDTIYDPEIFDFNSYYESINVPIYKINELSIYAEEQLTFQRLYLNLGVRVSSFFSENSGYVNAEPRLFASYKINEKFSTNVSLNRRMQYLHLIANQSIQQPNDLWLPSTNTIKPLEMYEAELGVNYQENKNLKLSLTGFYRQLNNVYSVPETVNFLSEVSNFVDYDYLVRGKGMSKGLELYCDYANEKRGVIFTYTLSKTERQFDSINLGLPFVANFDSRNQLSFALHQNIGKNFKIGLNWTFNSPQPRVNVIQFSTNGSFSNINEDPLGQKNTTKSSPYNRLDLSFQYNYGGKKLRHNLHVGVYNVFNTGNIAFYEVQYIDDATGKVFSKALKSLPILPSISYKINF